jgi:hypothetical protein
VSTTTQVPAVLDYMVAACQASTLIGAASPPVIVLDGPHITDDTLAEPLHLWIGYDPMSPGEATATTEADWPVLDHARTLDEAGEITCTAEAWSGGDVVKTLRDQCDAIVGAVDLLLRGGPGGEGPGDTTMGGLVFWSRVIAGSWYQRPSQSGISVMHVFKIVYQARLVSS